MRRVLGVAVLAAIALAAGGCGDDDDADSGATTAALAFDIGQYTGVYEGTWVPEGGGEGGAASIAIEAEPAESGVATLTIDFDGNYLGLGDPPAHVMEVPFDQTGAKGTGDNALFGDYDVTIDLDGTMVGRFTDVAAGVIPLLTYTGVLTGDTIDADYAVTRNDGSVTKARVELVKE